MNSSPVSPFQHGLINYVFSAIQLAVPAALGLDKDVVKMHRVAGACFLAGNALTATGVGVCPALTMKQHQRMDAGFLVALAATSFAKPFRTDRIALAFQLLFLAAGLTHFALTDYDG